MVALATSVRSEEGICQRPAGTPRWYPLHAGFDVASIFAGLTPLGLDDPAREAGHLARIFDLPVAL
ncbi:hypothetical protein [Micromonospora sp. NBC_00898]|uniref:hypothetical protein n=1 Tax=Micromonospora sp. NBC_00898 TaxID=2975981 RepID=UPI00386AABBC